MSSVKSALVASFGANVQIAAVPLTVTDATKDQFDATTFVNAFPSEINFEYALSFQIRPVGTKHVTSTEASNSTYSPYVV